MSVSPLARTLEQELFALLRGASLECLVCGEFVMRLFAADRCGAVACPECRSILVDGVEVPVVEIPAATTAT